jgi:meso-butanediol dehydrogenase/(S,S)-butanediol dehydrogenase/diacetyl reductase
MNRMGRLEGKVAIVTGGARGIGRGIALVLAREGADVAIADIDVENANRTATEVRALGHRASMVRADVSDSASAESCVARVIDELGRIDILVNNAGVVGSHALSSAVTLDDWDACYEVNLKGIWIMSSAVVPHFKENGGGKIVNISSMAGRKGGTALPHYAASKAGAISLTQSLAKTLGANNINVNAVCPGFLWTDMWRSIEAMISGNPDPEAVARRLVFDGYIKANCPLRREQWPEDIGQAVAFLASEDARNITGQSLNVDGGMELN